MLYLCDVVDVYFLSYMGLHWHNMYSIKMFK